MRKVSFFIIFTLGFSAIEWHYPYLNLFVLSIITFASFVIVTFSGLYMIADMQYHRVTYYRMFLKKYKTMWYLNLSNPLKTFVMVIVKFTRAKYRNALKRFLKKF